MTSATATAQFSLPPFSLRMAPKSGPASRQDRAARSYGAGAASSLVKCRPAAVRPNRAAVGAGVILAMLVGAVAIAVFMFTAPVSATSTPTTTNTSSQITWTVQPGDTLWQIARAAQPEGDVRPLVDELQSMRHGAPLQVGERIVVGG